MPISGNQLAGTPASLIALSEYFFDQIESRFMRSQERVEARQLLPSIG